MAVRLPLIGGAASATGLSQSTLLVGGLLAMFVIWLGINGRWPTYLGILGFGVSSQTATTTAAPAPAAPTGQGTIAPPSGFLVPGTDFPLQA